MRDDLFQNQESSIGSFTFDANVADVFADMIARSVPGYALTLEMIGVIAQNVFSKSSGLAYDLGCSLGASLLPILQNSSAEVIGVDLSPEMIRKAQTNLECYLERCTFLLEDISELELNPCRLIVSNFTLQFLPLRVREETITRCFNSLEPGGMMVLSEKVTHSVPLIEDTLIRLHHQFKQSQGYSELEIARKRDAIENILIPETKEVHIQRLHTAGFKQAFCWHQCFNFASFLAIKE